MASTPSSDTNASGQARLRLWITSPEGWSFQNRFEHAAPRFELVVLNYERCDDCFAWYDVYHPRSDDVNFGALCYWCGERLCCSYERDQFLWCGLMGKPLCESCMAWHADGGGPFEPSAQKRAVNSISRWFPDFDHFLVLVIASFLHAWHEP